MKTSNWRHYIQKKKSIVSCEQHTVIWYELPSLPKESENAHDPYLFKPLAYWNRALHQKCLEYQPWFLLMKMHHHTQSKWPERWYTRKRYLMQLTHQTWRQTDYRMLWWVFNSRQKKKNGRWIVSICLARYFLDSDGHYFEE